VGELCCSDWGGPDECEHGGKRDAWLGWLGVVPCPEVEDVVWMGVDGAEVRVAAVGLVYDLPWIHSFDW